MAACLFFFMSMVVISSNVLYKPPSFGWPKFENWDGMEKELNRFRLETADYLVEKIIQTQVNGSDMRSGLYLTHHGLLLENISKIEVKFHEQTYTLNDLCYKPHVYIYRNHQYHPVHVHRLWLEMNRLSPCLIVTPLNCFDDSYRIHQQISKWNTSTDFLNARLRNSHIESMRKDDERQYVYSNYGPELIKEWAELIRNLKSEQRKTRENRTDSFWYKDIQKWLSSIEPRGKVCADSIRSCETTNDAENYFNVCMTIQKLNEHHQKYKHFEMNNRDVAFTTELDCVDYREKFIEWMQEQELRTILKTFDPNFNLPDHEDLVDRRCEGIFHDPKAEPLEMFDVKRSFGDVQKKYDSIKLEIGLLTPEQIVHYMNYADMVNGREHSWTVDKASELLREFRAVLREDIGKFNEHRASRRIHVVSEVVTPSEVINPFDPIANAEHAEQTDAIFIALFFFHYFFLLPFSLLVWPNVWIHSVGMFVVRDLASAVIFLYLGNEHGIIRKDVALMSYIVLQLIANLYCTTRIAFCKDRLLTCIQRMRPERFSSNFSSAATALEGNPSTRQLNYAMERVTAYQKALDAYHPEEFFNKHPLFSCLVAILMLPVIFFYWYWIDDACSYAAIILCPTLVIGALEELIVRTKYIHERRQIKREIAELRARATSSQSLRNIMSGNHHPHDPQLSPPQGQKGKLLGLERTATDAVGMKIPNDIRKQWRYWAISVHFDVLRMGKKTGLFCCFVAFMALVVSAVLICVPVERAREEYKIPHSDIYIDLVASKMSEKWESHMASFREISDTMASWDELRLVTDWRHSFELFKNTTTGKPAEYHFYEWRRDEPINYALTARQCQVDGHQKALDPFRFRLRFEVEDSSNETIMWELVQRINRLLRRIATPDLRLKGEGLVYEHFHQLTYVWAEFASKQLVSTLLLGCLSFLAGYLFVTTPHFPAVLLFSLVSVATRVEFAALFSLLSLDDHKLYTNLALLVGFIATWTPFCELCLFRSRILAKEKARAEYPERTSPYRIRVPFIAAVDVAHFFGVFLSCCLFTIPICLVYPPLRVLIEPTVILIAIQLVALLNSTVLTIGAKIMFEKKVTQALKENLRAATTSERIYHLATKKAASLGLEAGEFEMEAPIQPQSPVRFTAPPPPKYAKLDPEAVVESEEDEDEEEEEDMNIDVIGIWDEDPPPPPPAPLPRLPLACALEAARALDRMPDWRRKRRSKTPSTPSSPSSPVREIVREDPPVVNEPSAKQAPLVVPNFVEMRGSGPAVATFPRMPNFPRAIQRAELEYELENVTDSSDDEDVPLNLGVASPVPVRVVAEPEEQEEPENGEMGLNANEDQNDDSRPSSSAPVVVDNRPSAPRIPTPPRRPRNMIPPYLRNAPRMYPRTHPRNPLIEPPQMADYIQDNDGITEPHPRAAQYPDNWTRAMVGYAEDRFWTERIVPLPRGLNVPPRPLDYLRQPSRSPTPEDFDWVPPPGALPFEIPPEVWALREARRQEHMRRQAQNQAQNQNQDRQEGGSGGNNSNSGN